MFIWRIWVLNDISFYLLSKRLLASLILLLIAERKSISELEIRFQVWLTNCMFKSWTSMSKYMDRSYLLFMFKLNEHRNRTLFLSLGAGLVCIRGQCFLISACESSSKVQVLKKNYHIYIWDIWLLHYCALYSGFWDFWGLKSEAKTQNVWIKSRTLDWANVSSSQLARSKLKRFLRFCK